MSRTGAQLLVAGLEAAGVDVVFGLPGVHNLAAWEALRESPIRLVGVRHEQAAVYAADGYARASGRLGVALVTTGPGAANTLGACGEAWGSRSPVLVVATDIPTGLRRRGMHRGVLHECVDQPGMFAPVTKERFTPTTFAELAFATFAAPEAAVRAPARPVYLEIPTDLLSATGQEPAMASGRPVPAAPDVEPALDLLADARRRLVWAGGGAVAAGASDAVGSLAECLGAPIVTTYSANGIAAGHPLRLRLPPPRPEVGPPWGGGAPGAAARAGGRRAVGRGRPRRRRRQRPRRHDDPELADAGPAAARGDQRGRRRRGEELPARRDRRRGRACGLRGARSRPLGRARPVGRCGDGPGSRAGGACRAVPVRDGVPRRVRRRGARRDRRPVRHVHPRLLARRLPRRARAAPAHVPAGVGDARLRVPPVARRGARRVRAGRVGLGRRRLPVRVRGARDGRAGAPAADDADRRRRRLRDAALRPAPLRRRDLRRRPPHPGLRRACRELRPAGGGGRGARGRLLRGARASPRRPGAERARGARGARAAADDVAALVPPGRLSRLLEVPNHGSLSRE